MVVIVHGLLSELTGTNPAMTGLLATTMTLLDNTHHAQGTSDDARVLLK